MEIGLFGKKNFLGILAFGVISGSMLLLAACSGVQGAVGPAGPTGPPGPQGPAAPLPAGTERQLSANITVSQPGNGTNFVAGEQAVVTVTLNDENGAAFDRAKDFAQLRLMLAGPQEPTLTVTAVKLLKTSADRSQPVHHFVDLTNNPDVQVSGDTLTYKLAAVSDEKPGTYIASVWAVEKADPLQQSMVTTRLQIGTTTVDSEIVDKLKCANCHLGTQSGKFYFAHTQVGFSPVGNPALDMNAPDNCVTCHNNDGYSAYTDPVTKTQVSDTLVHRVHGIHMGADLQNPTNTDPTTGVFASYTGVEFPADLKNCTACHIDDNYKTKPSQLACGTCHDNTWFGDLASMPKGETSHPGGPQANDTNCATCHPPDAGGLKAIAEAHDASVDVEYDKITLSLSAPRNGKFYVAGEKPVVTIVINDSTGKPIDHTKVVNANYSAANFMVYGPRASAKPVLTLAARTGNSKSVASVTSTIPASQQSATDNVTKGWTFAAGDTFKISINGGPVQEFAAPTGVQTAAQVVAWLTSNLSKDVLVTSNAAGNVNILDKIAGDNSKFAIYNSAVTTKMGWKPAGLPITKNGAVIGQTSGVTMEPYVIIGNLSQAPNDLRVNTDPNLTRNVNNITYQLDDVAGLTPGTYMAYSYINIAGVTTKNDWPKAGLGLTTFQVGTATPEPKIAENCTQCHGNNVMHLNESHVHPGLFDTDYCEACHDYNRSGTGDGYTATGGTSTSGWSGYGTKPIAARVHGVHFGAYLDHPEDVYSGDPNKFNDLVFPMDIRNCTVCHDKNTSGTWQTTPGRLACMACHDSDADSAHAILMTQNSNPSDPFSQSRTETCSVCHGVGKQFSVANVHNISNPYVPPYPRAK